MDTPPLDGLARASQQIGQGYTLHLRFQIPHRIFQGGLSHAASANPAEEFGTLAAVGHAARCQRGRQFLKNDRPGGISRLFAKVGMLARSALAPSG